MELVITSNTDGGGVVHLTDGGLQITTTNPEAITATFNNSNVNLPLSNIKLAGTATYDSGDIILSEGSTLTAIDTVKGNPLTYIASDSDTTLHMSKVASTPEITVSTAGQCIAIFGDVVYVVSHGSHISNPSRFTQLSAGTDLVANIADTVVLSDVGVYAVNGTFITNYVAGSTFTNSPDGSLVYNGVTYAAGEFTIDAAGNGIGIAISADLAGDFLPNYETDFANALQIVDAGALDNQLSEILPVNADLGELSFDTQPDKLTKPQIVIAPTK